MVQIKDATDKLKKIVAGATLMAGIAMGTGCDNAQQQLQKNPTEDVVNDNDTDNNYVDDANTDKPVENNDSDKPIENNDTDKPVENNDEDKPSEHDDSDKPVENNDEDKPSENDDNDDIINDDDTDIDNPDETNDNDDIPAQCSDTTLALTAEQIEAYPEDIQNSINLTHDNNRSLCPHGSVTEKEMYATTGDLCINDECHINGTELVPEDTITWVDNLPRLAFIDVPSAPTKYDILYYKKTEHLNKVGPTDVTLQILNMTIYVKDVPTTSCFAPNNIMEDASTNTMIIGDGCYSGGQSISPSGIVAKNVQPKITDAAFKEACNKVPNSKYSSTQKQCSTTITEFAWLENVIPYLHNKSYTKSGITKIEKNWNTNTFYVYLSVDDKHKWVVELQNAKRCLDECYGIEGCEVSIKPNPDLSNGCIVKEPENASLMRPNTKTNKQKNHARVDMKKLPKRNLTVSRVAQSLARRYTR